MHYSEIHALLKERFPGPEEKMICIPELDLKIIRCPFGSEKASAFLSGSERLFCEQHDVEFADQAVPGPHSDDGVNSSDFDIRCNKYFNYYIVRNNDDTRAGGCIFLFHGLNEKHWDKYLPWAYAIARRTGKAIILFPIAFHMDRSPEAWSNKGLMLEVARSRAARYPENSGSSSLINAATSSRLEQFPQRLFWSGLQTYADVVRLIGCIKNDEVPEIQPLATIDLFGYSIGAFLSLILKMADPEAYFTESRLLCFCGGMTIDRMFPVSKYIMDASAAIAMQSCFAELLSADFATDERLSHFQNAELHPDESWFKTMLRYNYFAKEREAMLQRISHQVKAIVLRQDEVAPPVEALNTLQGGYRDIPIEVIIEDYDHPYSHMNPFSLVTRHQAAVDIAFERFAGEVAKFLK